MGSTVAELTSYERVSRIMNGQTPDRVPLGDAYWSTTLDRWHREGMPEDVAPGAYFGTDEIVRLGGDYSLQLPEHELERTATTRTYWDAEGALRIDSHTDHGWTTRWLDFSIKTRDDWPKYRERMAYNPSRVADDTLERYRWARDNDRFVCYGTHAVFHPTWMRTGMVRLLMLMLDDPEFGNDLYAAQAQLIIDTYDGMRSMGMDFDGAFLADDLGYQAAPLVSPALYADLILPHHKRMTDHFAKGGLKTFLHSDGNIAPLIPGFIKAGFGGLHPLEVKAGLDVRELVDAYGDDLVFFGNIDARILAGSRQEIEAEIVSKLEAVKGRAGSDVNAAPRRASVPHKTKGHHP